MIILFNNWDDCTDRGTRTVEIDIKNIETIGFNCDRGLIEVFINNELAFKESASDFSVELELNK